MFRPRAQKLDKCQTRSFVLPEFRAKLDIFPHTASLPLIGVVIKSLNDAVPVARHFGQKGHRKFKYAISRAFD